MKKEDFLKLMDGIDDRLVEKYAISDEAEARQKQIRRQRRQRWLNRVTGCAVAAIILGVIGVAMLCASFGVVRMDRQSQKTPVSLGDGNDSQNNENNGDEEKELLLQAYLFYIGVEEQDIQEIQKMDQQPETILLARGDSEQQSVSIETAVYFVYTTNQDKVLAVLAFDLPDKAVQYGCSEIEIEDNWEQYEVSQANAVLYSEETQEFQSLRCDTTNEYQLAISGISSAKGNTQSTSRMVVSFTVDRTRRQPKFRGVSGSISPEKYILVGAGSVDLGRSYSDCCSIVVLKSLSKIKKRHKSRSLPVWQRNRIWSSRRKDREY